MGFSDALFESIEIVIDSVVSLHDDDEIFKEIPKNKDIIEFTALCLKLASKSLILKTDKEALKRVESFDWKKRAEQYIKKYLENHYLE